MALGNRKLNKNSFFKEKVSFFFRTKKKKERMRLVIEFSNILYEGKRDDVKDGG
jgi:hypothetical protein